MPGMKEMLPPFSSGIAREAINIVKYHDMNRATLIERIEEARTVLERVLALAQVGAS